jgi:malate dehydrogenase (oxaloacetate-decarboxylating)(NADP+)
MTDTPADAARLAALHYHEFPKPGKLEIRASKPMANGRDLARAYSPGVAEASIEIKNNPDNVSRYTAREIWWPLYQTVQLFWDWEILARLRPNP